MSRPAVGVIINPVAGIGGPAALHGSDGSAGERAREMGAVSAAPHRMQTALRALAEGCQGVTLVTASGEMGSRVAAEVGLTGEEIAVATERTGAQDTRNAARLMRDRGVDLILFAGGDGTARDVFDAVGTTVPILGVPAGVKMHSAVFAVNPRAAGAAAAAFLSDASAASTVDAEVADLTSQQSNETPGSISIFGIAKVPAEPTRIQAMKSGSTRSENADLEALGREVAAEMKPDHLYLLGPGTTVAHVKTAAGIAGSVLGFDVVADGELIQRDATEQQLFDLVNAHPAATLVLGVIGGQGFLLGRGNQQISARVLAAVGGDNVIILAAEQKLSLLNPPVLRVDLELDTEGPAAPESIKVSGPGIVTGYRKVRTRPRHSTVVRVVS